LLTSTVIGTLPIRVYPCHPWLIPFQFEFIRHPGQELFYAVTSQFPINCEAYPANNRLWFMVLSLL